MKKNSFSLESSADKQSPRRSWWVHILTGIAGMGLVGGSAYAGNSCQDYIFNLACTYVGRVGINYCVKSTSTETTTSSTCDKYLGGASFQYFNNGFLGLTTGINCFPTWDRCNFWSLS